VTAPDGDYIMEDGTVYVIASNEVIEIKEPEEDEMAKKDEEIADLKAQLEASTAENVENKTTIENLTKTLGEVKTEVEGIKNTFSKKVFSKVDPSKPVDPAKQTGSRTASRKVINS
jgi:regulator of replication initiation timing